MFYILCFTSFFLQQNHLSGVQIQNLLNVHSNVKIIMFSSWENSLPPPPQKKIRKKDRIFHVRVYSYTIWIQDKIVLICLLNGVISVLYLINCTNVNCENKGSILSRSFDQLFLLLILQFTFSARLLSHIWCVEYRTSLWHSPASLIWRRVFDTTRDWVRLCSIFYDIVLECRMKACAFGTQETLFHLRSSNAFRHMHTHNRSRHYF